MAGRWEDAGVVRGFSTAAPNEVLLAFVRSELGREPGLRVLDLGCGAARNAAPTAAEELVAELLLAGFEKTRWNASGTAGPTRRSTRPSYQGVKP